MIITKSYFQEIAEQEEANFQKNRAGYAEHYLLLEDIERAYRLFLNGAVDVRKANKDEARYFDCLKICVNISHQLSLSVLALFREHVGDSNFHLRKAIELFGFTSLISKSEDDAKKWREAAKNDKAYAEYKKAFAAHNVFPFTDEGLKLLYESYDSLNKNIHSSILSVDEYLTPTTKDGSKAIGSSTFTADLPSLRFKGQANWIIITHGVILMLLPQIFDRFEDPKLLKVFQEHTTNIMRHAKPLNEETSRAFGLEPPVLENF